MTLETFNCLTWVKGDKISVYGKHFRILLLPVIGVDFNHRIVYARYRGKECKFLIKDIIARIRFGDM